MVADQVTNDLVVWGLTFAVGSAFTWLAWLTLRHFNYAVPVYRRMTGDDMVEGYVDKTRNQFDDLETSHEEQSEQIDEVDRKVEHVDDRVDHVERHFEERFDRVEDKVDTIVEAVVPKEQQDKFKTEDGGFPPQSDD